jgi:hypothetical protein
MILRPYLWNMDGVDSPIKIPEGIIIATSEVAWEYYHPLQELWLA